MALLKSAGLIAYLRNLESHNQGKSWQQIATKLHQHFYAHDASIVIWGIPLFKDGAENKGWQSVSLPTKPSRTILVRGISVNVAHCYGGIRAVLNRSAPSAFIMKHINTGLGDSIQVWSDQITGIKQNLLGSLEWWVSPASGQSKILRGRKMFAHAEKWKPPAQVRGNRLGLVVAAYLTKGKADRLSQGFEMAFKSSRARSSLLTA